MKYLAILILISVFIFWGCNTEDVAEHQMAENDGVFIHISHGPEDAHRVLMALQMAVMMSEDKDVLVYFDITGIAVVLNDAEAISFSHFPNARAQLEKLLSKQVPVMACPGCLKAAGKTTDDLMQGVQVADKERFFNFTSGRILTLNY